MPRLLVLWARPGHLSAEEAESWVRGEVRGLLADDAVRSARLTRLESASPRHDRPWHWLLDLEIARDLADHAPSSEWLADLQLLGMRPEVVRVGDVVALEDR